MKPVNPVGPILIAGEMTDAIILAIQEINTSVTIKDHGAYLRVSVPEKCYLTHAVLEKMLGRPFLIPGDLEKVLLSSQGTLTISDEKVSWEYIKEENRSASP